MDYLFKFTFIFIKATYLPCLNKTVLKSKYWKTATPTPSFCISPTLPARALQLAAFISDTSGIYLLPNTVFFSCCTDFSNSSLTLPTHRFWSPQPPNIIISHFLFKSIWNTSIIMLIWLVMCSLTCNFWLHVNSLELTYAFKICFLS